MIGNFLTYLIESTICFTIMYSFYKYVFYQSTHFDWNRWYFLIAVIISFAIPIFPFPFSLSSTVNSNNLIMISPSDGTGLLVFTDQSSFWEHSVQEYHFFSYKTIRIYMRWNWMRSIFLSLFTCETQVRNLSQGNARFF